MRCKCASPARVPEGATEISSQAKAHHLACVHIARFGSPQDLLEEARAAFGGGVDIPDDGDRSLTSRAIREGAVQGARSRAGRCISVRIARVAPKVADYGEVR